MNNDEAMVALVAKRTAINTAIDELTRYVREKPLWKAADESRQMATIKRFASSGGADLSAWDGTSA